MSSKTKSSRRKPGDAWQGGLKKLPIELDAETFVATWNAAQSLKSFAERFSLSCSTCALYAARLRDAGHELKWFKKGRPRLLKI